MADKSEEYILGIEISEHSLRVVQRHIPSNVIDLVHIEPLSLPNILSGDGLTVLLRQVVRIYRKLLRTRVAAISLPYSMTFIRVMQLDSDSGDLKEQIEWEIEQQTVGRGGRQVFDWIPLNAPKSGKPDTETQLAALTADVAGLDDLTSEGGTGKEKSDVRPGPGGAGPRYLVVAADEERIKWMEDSCRKVRILPVICDVDVLALVNIFALNYPEDLSEGAALVYLTGTQALVCLTRDGSYAESDRVEAIKFDSPEAVRQSVKRIEEKVAELAAHAVSPGKPGPFTVKRCFLCGDAAADTRVRDPLLAAFTLPAETLNPFRSVLVAQEIKSQVLMVAPALAVVTGLTLRIPGEGRP